GRGATVNRQKFSVPRAGGASDPLELLQPCRLNPRPGVGFSILRVRGPDGRHPTRRSTMALERTLSIIKPDAVAKNVIGEIYSRCEKAGLKVAAAKMKQLSRAEAEGFYAVHRERPFFNALVDFMISGPVMIQVLEGEGAIAKNRELMGATN